MTVTDTSTGAHAAAAPAAPPALEVEHVSAAYGPYRALFDVSFSVPAAGVVALLGSNGAGKSTIARVISGLLPATTGTVRVAGKDVTRLPAHTVSRAGLWHVPEGRGVFSNLTVEENLTLAFRERGGRRSVAPSLARTFEEFPVLGQRRRQRGGTLSGGEQRLLSLAKVLVEPPKLLVADELSLGLAPVIVDAVYDGLRKINAAGTAILVVEQQVDRALDLATDAIVLEHGAVAYSGPAGHAKEEVEKVLAARGDRTVLVDHRAVDRPPKEPVDPVVAVRRQRRWSLGRRGGRDETPGTWRAPGSAGPSPTTPAADPSEHPKEGTT